MRPLLHCCRLLPVLLVLLLFLVPPAGHGAPPENVSPPARVPVQEAVQNGPAEDTGPGVLDQLKELPEERPAPIRTEQIDRAGEQLGLRIGVFGRELAPHLGDWVNRELVWGISWLKLLFCGLLLVLVFMVERLVRWLIRRRLRIEAARTDAPGWYAILLRGLSGPCPCSSGCPAPTAPCPRCWATSTGPARPGTWSRPCAGRPMPAAPWPPYGSCTGCWACSITSSTAGPDPAAHRGHDRGRAVQALPGAAQPARAGRFRPPGKPAVRVRPGLQTLIGQLFGILLIVAVTG